MNRHTNWRRRGVSLIGVLTVGLSTVFSAGGVRAASPFTVSEPAQPALSADAFLPHATEVYAKAQDEVTRELQAPQYFVVPGKLINGQWWYGYTMSFAKGVVVKSIEVAADNASHTQLFAFGLAVPSQSPGTLTAKHGGGTAARAAHSRKQSGFFHPLTCLPNFAQAYVDYFWYDNMGMSAGDVRDAEGYYYGSGSINCQNGADAIGANYSNGWSYSGHSELAFIDSGPTAVVTTNVTLSNGICQIDFNSQTLYGSASGGFMASTNSHSSCSGYTTSESKSFH